MERRPSRRRGRALSWARGAGAAGRVLDVHVVDAVGELEREGGGIEVLMGEMGRVEVDPEGGPAADGVEGLPRGHEVVGDLRGVDLEPEAHPLGLEDVHDRIPGLGHGGVAALDLRRVVGREGVEEVPDRRAREAVYLGDAEAGRGPRHVLHALGGPRAHARGIPVAPDFTGKDGLVAGIDGVADRLADEMGADGPAAQAVALEQLSVRRAVAVLGQGARHVEVVAPAGQLQAVVAPLAGHAGQLGDREIRPLAGEQRDRAGAAHAGAPWTARTWSSPASSAPPISAICSRLIVSGGATAPPPACWRVSTPAARVPSMKSLTAPGTRWSS